METKNCQNCKKEFTITEDDKNFYNKIKVPTPTFCPQCRMIRRFVYRNERKLFKTIDAFNGKPIFSLYPSDAERKVVTQDEWFSDSWSADDYARDYDFSQNFFSQLFQLDKDVPIYGLNVKGMVRSDYCGNASYLKDCYLLFNSNVAETSLYGNSVDRCRDCVDNTSIGDCERCYESFWLAHCYQCYFCIMCVESRNMWFSRDCLGCSDCFGCANLRKVSYCIFNVQYSKEEYFAKLEAMNLDTQEGLADARTKAREFWNIQPLKYHQGLKNLNADGAYVTNSKNVHEGYLVRESENINYSQYLQVPKNKDCWDASIWGQDSELLYETSVCGENAYNLRFSWDCWPNVRDCEYSLHLKSCSDCFGCVGLTSKQYCILNKQYSKDEYFEMVEKIKKHMDDMPYVDMQGLVYKYGEFFPIELSPFGYNNTIAQQQFPITKDEAVVKNYPWIEIPRGEYEITKSYSALPASIKNTDESVTKEVISCTQCSYAYKITIDEFNFLQNENLPIPNLCPECRHERRISDRLKPYLRHHMCDKEGCTNEFETPYGPETPNKIYCESCYQQEVI